MRVSKNCLKPGPAIISRSFILGSFGYLEAKRKGTKFNFS